MPIMKQRLDKGGKTFQGHRTAQYRYLWEMSTVLGVGACAVNFGRVLLLY